MASPLRAAGWLVLGLLCLAALAMAFQVAWRHVRFSPGLVDEWPGGAPGFGLSCALAVLTGRTGTLRCLRHRSAGRARIPAATACAALCLLGVLYGLAVVPPRWCHQSTSPSCTSLPGAASAGLFFLATLIAAFFIKGACSSGVVGRCEREVTVPAPGTGDGAERPPPPRSHPSPVPKQPRR
ncbi:MAG TPA: hypothetical protein VGO89_14060 [Streptomyces sp.]|nr:hypothetical protein [Streptomyces sp.]